MRLTEQFRNRLQKLAGMDPKKMDPKMKEPFPILKQPPTGSDGTGSMSYACTPCEGCQPSSTGPFSSIEECEGTCSETNIDTFFDSCPGPQCGGFNTKEEFCNRCEVEYESTQMWAAQNSLPNCDCCNINPPETEGCTDPAADNYDSNATIENNTCEYANFDACAELETNPTQYYVVEFGDYAALNPNQVSDTFSNVICNNACHTDSWNMGGGFQYGTCLSWATIYINPEVACQEVYDNYNFNQIASINSYNNCPDNANNPETCCVNITGPLG